MTVTEKLITVNRYSRPGIKRDKTTQVVVHYVANPGSTAIANRNYFDNLKAGIKDEKGNYLCVSAHYVVGFQGEAIRCIPEEEWAYSSNSANAYCISIEVCHPDSTGKFTEVTESALAELVADICKRWNLDPESDVIRHYDVTGKACPLWYVSHPEDWAAFKGKVKSILEPQSVLYRVQVGAFSVRENAARYMEQVKAAGFPAFIVEVKQ